MKAQLIILDNPIIVTDEEIEEQDFYYNPKTRYIPIKQSWEDSHKMFEGAQKIISHNKPIDYNGIDFGIVDVEKLAEGMLTSHRDFKSEGMSEYQNGRFNGIIEGFKASQQLNEKKFTLDDLRDAFESGEDYGKTWSEFYNTDSISRAEAEKTSDFNDFIKELSIPKTFEVEIEETPTNIKIIKKL